MLFQTGNLLDHLTVAETSCWRSGSPDGSTGTGTAVLDEVGLAERAHVSPAQLSGGETARAGLAVALGQRPLRRSSPTNRPASSTRSRRAGSSSCCAAARAGAAVLVVTHNRVARRPGRSGDRRLADGRAGMTRGLGRWRRVRGRRHHPTIAPIVRPAVSPARSAPARGPSWPSTASPATSLRVTDRVDRAVRIGQDHPSPPLRRPRPTDRRHRGVAGIGTRAAARSGRRGVPGPEPPATTRCHGERGPPAAPPRRRPACRRRRRSTR